LECLDFLCLLREGDVEPSLGLPLSSSQFDCSDEDLSEWPLSAMLGEIVLKWKQINEQKALSSL
jgi:hypothetical protein